MAKAKSDYYTNVVSDNAENPRQPWNCINKIKVMHRLPAPTLSNHVLIKSLCDSFFTHFKNKTSMLLSAFPDYIINTVQLYSPQVNSLLASFTSATVDEVRQIIMSSLSKK